MKRAGVIALAAGILFLSAPVQADPIVQTVEEHRDERGEIDRREDAFVHRPSGYVFPAALGEMPARRTITYGQGDASLYYTLRGGANGDPWLSLYVYPATLEFAAEAAGVEESLLGAMPGAAIDPPQGLPPSPTGAVEKWYQASAEGMAVVTGYRLIRAGDWYIKVRLTVPKSGGQAALERAWNGLAAVPWSIPAGAKASHTAAIGS